jgi:hypothetical protein
MLLCTTVIFCADTPQKNIIPKQMPAGLRHLEELEELDDLVSSQEYSEIQNELKSALPRTPASRRDPVVFDPKHMSSPLKAVIDKIYEQHMIIDFSNDDAIE